VDTIARLVADFLMRTRQYGEMQRLATMDELTGLMNRMQMLPLIGQEVERSSRYNVPLSVVMLDLDLFKRINDTFGHMIGDRVLAGFAQILKNGSRRVDYVFRYGGEEFLALLPHTPPDNAKIYAERIRRTVRDSLHVSANLESPITISAGISSLPGSGKSVEDLVGAADAALYRAKQEGRDRVCLG
jgi:diguanylate cyclase (GGDEF)-like protein